MQLWMLWVVGGSTIFGAGLYLSYRMGKKAVPVVHGSTTPGAVPADEIEPARVVAKPRGNVSAKVDETKRKSRQPMNQAIVAKGSVHIDSEKPRQPTRHVRPTPKLEGEFSHKFFGSQLIIHNRVIAGSLPRKMHLLEITSQDQVFIDGHPQTALHVSDIEALKSMVRDNELLAQK